MKFNLHLASGSILTVFFILLIGAPVFAEESAADFHKKGIEALKESQTNPGSIVTAARCFARQALIPGK